MNRTPPPASFHRHRYQLVDDTLDFIGDEGVMGKKGHGSDMQLGLTTGTRAFYPLRPLSRQIA